MRGRHEAGSGVKMLAAPTVAGNAVSPGPGEAKLGFLPCTYRPSKFGSDRRSTGPPQQCPVPDAQDQACKHCGTTRSPGTRAVRSAAVWNILNAPPSWAACWLAGALAWIAAVADVSSVFGRRDGVRLVEQR